MLMLMVNSRFPLPVLAMFRVNTAVSPQDTEAAMGVVSAWIEGAVKEKFR